MKRIILLALAFILVACTAVPMSEYNQNLAKWEKAGPTHYRYTLFIGCFCAFMGDMPLTVEVQNGEPISVTKADGTVVTAEDPSYEYHLPYLTIDRLFLTLKADSTDADEVTATYNAEYGFPESVSVDRIKEAIDDEIAYQVSNFEVLK